MRENLFECFAGFGQNTIMDFCHSLGVHPATPGIDLCLEDNRFFRFREQLSLYMGRWRSKSFLDNLCVRSNDANPFAFNWALDRRYTKLAIDVYRKATVTIDRELYNQMAREGLFDPRHVIG